VSLDPLEERCSAHQRAGPHACDILLDKGKLPDCVDNGDDRSGT
jgi:hypothetical protein